MKRSFFCDFSPPVWGMLRGRVVLTKFNPDYFLIVMNKTKGWEIKILNFLLFVHNTIRTTIISFTYVLYSRTTAQLNSKTWFSPSRNRRERPAGPVRTGIERSPVGGGQSRDARESRRRDRADDGESRGPKSVGPAVPVSIVADDYAHLHKDIIARARTAFSRRGRYL